MAIIRIVLQVKQQQFRIDYIEQSPETQLELTQPEYQMSQYNNRLNSSQQQEEENRIARRGPLRRQAHMLAREEQNETISQQVPEEIRPALDMIQLEEQNQIHSFNQPSFTHPSTQFKTIHSQKLQVRLRPEPATTTTKQTVFEKIYIHGIVWNKEINGLFDYEEKDKNEKSTIIIEEDVKSYINFVSGAGLMLPRGEDCFLLIFKTKLKKMVYEKSLLRDVRIAALRRQLGQSKQTLPKDDKQSDKEFLCAFKLVMNLMTNQLKIKVYSLDELNEQVQSINKKFQSIRAKRIEFREQVENLQVQSEQKDKVNEQLKPESLQIQVPAINNLLEVEKRQASEPYFIIRTLSKSSPTQALGCKLYPGDLIKMGKVEFKVISIDGVSVQNKTQEQDRRAIEMTQVNEEEEKQVECKYCLGGKSEQANNFFVHLCNCRGHIGYVHYECLTRWTTTKSTIDAAQNVKMYYLEKMKCEVCLKEFPKYFKYNGKLYHILPIDLPQKHLTLVDVSQKQDANTAVITGVENNTIVIGRGRNAHLKVTDITVSREHATITRIGEDYYIKDCKSKFGTLVRSSETQIETEIEHKKGFQINNVIFTVQIIKKEVFKEKEVEKSSQKVLTYESIREQKEGSTEVNDSMRQSSVNISISTAYKRLSESERNQGSSFDLERLNPHINLREEIKNVHDQNNQILQEQDEQTRTTKKDLNNLRENNTRATIDRIERISELRRQLQQRMIHQQMGKEEEDIELENYQNTTNVNNNQNELIQAQVNDKPQRGRSRRIQFEEDDNNEPRVN